MTDKIISADLITSGMEAVTLNSGDTVEVLTGVTVSASSGFAGIFSTASNVTASVDGTVFGSNGIFFTSGSSGDTVRVGTQGAVIGMDNGIDIAGAATVTNSGEISSVQADAISMGANSQLLNNGTIDGDTVALVGNGGTSIVNNGTMSAESNNAILESSGNNTLVNHGTIDSNSASHYGVDFLSSGNSVTNTGTISGGTTGVYFNTGGGTNILDNSGTISGVFAVDMGTGGGTIANDGHLDGAVNLGVGTHLTNTGTIDGNISGAGTVFNDGTIEGSLTFDAASTYNGTLGSITGAVNGSSGADKLVAGADGETLIGNDGNDVLKAGSGDDTLNGGAGRDKLIAGTGDDTFVFQHVDESRGAHYDTIVGFDAFHDTIDAGVPVDAVKGAFSGALDSGAGFTSELSAILTPANLPAHDAALVVGSTGTLAGHSFLVIDANGVAGYQASGDYVIQLFHAVNQSLTPGNFG
ncbi:MAG TPA: calcium-binding protein [Rhizomicrobium sp.]|jgi:Ca2+-binding RTX toxin-like protein